MSKAPAKPEAEGDAPPPKRSKKMLILVLVLVLLLLIVSGAAAVLFLKSRHSGNEADAQKADAHSNEPPKVVVDKGAPPTFVNLDPFTVNLAPGEGDHYLQTVLVLRVANAKIGEELKVYMPEIRHRINLILSSKKPSDVATIEGRENLADEITVETNDVLGYPPPQQRDRRQERSSEPQGPVLETLFNTFIIQ